MERVICFCLALFAGYGFLCAQNPNTAAQEINSVKSQPDVYLYAEATAKTWEEALDNAKFLLGINMETWVKGNGEKDVAGCVAKAQNHVLEIKSMRGDRYRVFVYVKKTDIMPYSSKDQLVVVPMNNSEDPSVNLVSVQQEEGQSLPTQTQEEHKILAPSDKEQSVNDVKEVIPTQNLTMLEKAMLSVEDASQIQGFIKKYEAQQLIQKYGKYKDLPQNRNCYLFVYSKDYQIAAYLYKKDNGEYINLKTHKADDISNYRGCGAFWFISNDN